MTPFVRKAFIGIGLLSVGLAGFVVHLSYNGQFEESFSAPDGKARLDAYRLLSVSDFLMHGPGDGGWGDYVFRLEVDGFGEVRRSSRVRMNLRNDPPRWDGRFVTFHGNPDIQCWDLDVPESR